MVLRILEYEIEIMRSALNEINLNKKEYKIPLIIPIVLYTGNRKWDANTYIKNMQEKLEGYKGTELGKFELIDINNYSKTELLKEDTILSKIMLAEKSKDKIDLLNNIEISYKEISKKTNEKIYNKNQKNRYINIMYKIVKDKIGEDNTKKFFDILINEGRNEDMLAIYDTIDNENRQLINRGIKTGIKTGIIAGKKEIAKKMLNNKIDIKMIIDITGLNEKEILKLKKESV